MGTTVQTQHITYSNEFTIYPNPFTQQSTIYFDSEQKNTIILLYDLLGNQIYRINFSGKQFVIESSDLSAGVYFVKTIDINKSSNFRKIVIK